MRIEISHIQIADRERFRFAGTYRSNNASSTNLHIITLDEWNRWIQLMSATPVEVTALCGTKTTPMHTSIMALEGDDVCDVCLAKSKEGQ